MLTFLTSKIGKSALLVRCLEVGVVGAAVHGLHAAAQSNAPVQGVNLLTKNPNFCSSMTFQLRVSANRVILALGNGVWLLSLSPSIRCAAQRPIRGAMLGEPVYS